MNIRLQCCFSNQRDFEKEYPSAAITFEWVFLVVYFKVYYHSSKLNTCSSVDSYIAMPRNRGIGILIQIIKTNSQNVCHDL